MASAQLNKLPKQERLQLKDDIKKVKKKKKKKKKACGDESMTKVFVLSQLCKATVSPGYVF